MKCEFYSLADTQVGKNKIATRIRKGEKEKEKKEKEAHRFFVERLAQGADIYEARDETENKYGVLVMLKEQKPIKSRFDAFACQKWQVWIDIYEEST